MNSLMDIDYHSVFPIILVEINNRIDKYSDNEED